MNGRIEGYPITEKKLTPWYYQSKGRTMVSPLATAESIVWTSESGELYVGNSETLGMRFRMETGSEIFSAAVVSQAASVCCFRFRRVFAMQEMTGMRQWKYATGFPVKRASAR